jgi:uncharacterized protein YcgL (UPF0745 family)
MDLIRKSFFIFVLIFIFGGYFVYQSRGVLNKPKIFVNRLDDFNVVYKSSLLINGRSENALDLFLNGRRIFTNEDGFFEEEMILASGYNLIQFKAKDRFGNEVKKNYIVMLKQR